MANLFTDAFPNGSVIDVTTTSPGGVGSPVILENNQCNVTISNGAPAKWACEMCIRDSYRKADEGVRVLVMDAETRHLDSREAYEVVWNITKRAMGCLLYTSRCV